MIEFRAERKFRAFVNIAPNWAQMSPVMGERWGKVKSPGVDFGEFPQGCGGALKRKKGAKKDPMALFRVGQNIF